MIRYTFILLLVPLRVFSQDRLPSFQSIPQWFMQNTDLLYPKVKKLVTTNYSFYNDSLKFTDKLEYTFSKNKINTIKSINPKSDFVFMIRTYDKYMRIINLVRFYNYIKKETYNYDDNNYKSTERLFNDDLSIFQKTEIYYNKKCQPIKKVEYNGDTVISCYWTYKYNSFEDLIEEIFINMPNGHGTILDSSITGDTDKFFPTPNDTTSYSLTYDSLKRPITKTEYYNSKKKKLTEYNFSKDSSMIKTTYYSTYNSKPTQIDFEIKHDSIKILKTQFLNGDDSTKIREEYVSLYVHNVKKESSVPNTYTVTDYKYMTDIQYDSHKNWTKKTFFENGRINRIIERKITY